ncbi:hypothetical protein DM02DRAFT_731407 [Periconia macrospinosa]|uniref:Uncharacterized protein n=1 Tax=Periconia macrospinosa TaxID=97972 RepID=A0A2V1DDG7_9PLEO|nr:hypothetical protein DM02DRAFT_731407 [Periconia macrospinosa]
MADINRVTSPALDASSGVLSIPDRNDSIVVLHRNLAALAEAVRRGQSVAYVTNYIASTAQERDATKTAVADMPLQEREVWVENSSDINKIAPSSPASSNRLYGSEKADPGHPVWFTKNESAHLPLVKAMARVIGAGRYNVGGQCGLNAMQFANLQSVNEILSIAGRIVERSGLNSMSATISAAQQPLGFQRSMLQQALGGSGKKRKRDSQFM